ncbi:hypothetical protein M9H77_29026 [Catharanthus roseus]|uniref:Uncharacterized protein n=1 Tax=Catharanthus roseus TaxID=4058 RepID=A0ACC0ALC9_CATRO|nr:hypothetical protein M9H77_29026 [Catharanthus roseus]
MFSSQISLERSGAPRATEMTHPSHRWTYRKGTLIDEPSRTTSSSSYSLREIIPEREPIPVIDLSDDESVEGPEMAPVAPGIGLGTSIEEDLSEPTSDSEMMPEPDGVAPADTEGTGTFTAGGSPLSVSPICGYCLWCEQRAEAASQQVVALREEISRMDILFYAECQARRQETARAAIRLRIVELLETSMATRRNERVPATGADEAIERFLKFRTPEFYGDVEQEIKEWQRISGLELPKHGHLRTNHGPGTIFKKNSKRSTYLVGFVSNERMSFSNLDRVT